MPKCYAVLLLPAALAAQLARTVPVDNQYVQVVDVVDPPHSKGPLHDHKLNRVMVYLGKCDTRLTEPGGRVDQQHWKFGDVAWSPAGGPHVSENPNDQPCRIIEIELKAGAGRRPVAPGALDAVKVDPKHYKVLLENEHVRVLRATYGPGETGAVHQHDLDRVVVFLTDSELQVSGADGQKQTLRTKPGQVSWGTFAKHQEHNAGSGPFDVIAVELKYR